MQTFAAKEIRVELGSRSYPIRIGRHLLRETGRMLRELRPGCRCAIITDENVDALHGDTLRDSIRDAGIEATTFAVAPGEQSKSMTVLETVVSNLLEAKLERGDLVIAFGGGVVGDLAGFAAAICRRGMDFVQIPTSLLAQVDSSVGGKTGINSKLGKNLIGAFHQPVMVIADTALLKTLPDREFAAGYAEVVKYGLINDRPFFEFLSANREKIFSYEVELDEAIARSCKAKASIVAADETEKGQRALLNLGHTFGHALEGAVRYDQKRLVHGEGVSIGLASAFRFSNLLGLAPIADVESVERHLVASRLPVRMTDIPGHQLDPEEVFQFIAQDKKVMKGKLTFILTRGIGESYIENDVDPEKVRTFLREAICR